MNKSLIAALMLLMVHNILSGQTKVERENRSVYNRIEYFFNNNQLDSVYSLANADFKKQISAVKLREVLNYFAYFGRITHAESVTFNQGVAGYELNIGSKKALLNLAIDSNFNFSLFKLAELDNSLLKKEIVLSNVVKKSPLDVFIDSTALTYIRQANTQSLAIGVIHNNKSNTFFYGETKKGNKTLPTTHTLYEIGSITKTFTATLLAYFVENGLINLDESIAKFLPDSVASNPSVQKITFKSLANHTSGLPRLPSNLEKAPNYNANNPYASYSAKELFEYLKNFKAEHRPEENFEYSNLGFGLLGELLSRIAAKPYPQLIQDTIAAPLGLTNTVEKLNPKTQQLVSVYNHNGQEVTPWTFQALSGAGSLRSTVNDLLKYTLVQFRMPENKLEQAMMLTRQFSYFIPPNTDIGLGWHMNMVDDVIYYWHNGGTAGSRSFIAFTPDKKLALVVLSNAAIDVDSIGKSILDKLILTK